METTAQATVEQKSADRTIRALAVHMSFTSGLWNGNKHSERIEAFEQLLQAYANGELNRSAFDVLEGLVEPVASTHPA